MPGEVDSVTDQATADQAAPNQDIDLDRAAEDAERRLAVVVPDATPAEEVKDEPAAQPVVEEVKEPVADEPPKEGEDAQDKTPDPPKLDPEDHKERTKLGRKVAELGETVGKLLEQNNLLLQQLMATKTSPAPAQEPEPEYLDLSTPEGMRKFMAQEREREQAQVHQDKVQYAGGYAAQVK